MRCIHNDTKHDRVAFETRCSCAPDAVRKLNRSLRTSLNAGTTIRAVAGRSEPPLHKISRGACESCLASAGRLHTWQGCPASQPPVRRVPSERAPFVPGSGVFSPDLPEQLFSVCTRSGRYVTLFLPSFPANLLAKRTTHRPFHYSTTALQYLSYILPPTFVPPSTLPPVLVLL